MQTTAFSSASLSSCLAALELFPILFRKIWLTICDVYSCSFTSIPFCTYCIFNAAKGAALACPRWLTLFDRRQAVVVQTDCIDQESTLSIGPEIF